MQPTITVCRTLGYPPVDALPPGMTYDFAVAETIRLATQDTLVQLAHQAGLSAGPDGPPVELLSVSVAHVAPPQVDPFIVLTLVTRLVSRVEVPSIGSIHLP